MNGNALRKSGTFDRVKADLFVYLRARTILKKRCRFEMREVRMNCSFLECIQSQWPWVSITPNGCISNGCMEYKSISRTFAILFSQSQIGLRYTFKNLSAYSAGDRKYSKLELPKDLPSAIGDRKDGVCLQTHGQAFRQSMRCPSAILDQKGRAFYYLSGSLNALYELYGPARRTGPLQPAKCYCFWLCASLW